MTAFEKAEFLRFIIRSGRSVFGMNATVISYIDITYCISGEMHYIYKGQDVTLYAGDAILFPQGSLRERYESDKDAHYCSLNVIVPEDFVPEAEGYLPNSVRSDTVQILNSVKKAFDTVSEEKYAKCLSLFWYLYYQLIETAKNNEYPHIKHIKQYIAAHLCESITLARIAESVHLAPHYCSALFSKHMGKTIFDFIAERRIELAKGLIITTDMTMNEIAERCGYEDCNYFSRTFKKVTGTTATAFRKNSGLKKDKL